MDRDEPGLRVAIIGAGMGGLACALALAKHGIPQVDVYETASNLGFVGAGIQLAPNMGRILDRLGCWETIAMEATDIKSASIRKHNDNKELAHVDLSYIRREYGMPHMVEYTKACKKEKAITFHFKSSCSDIKSWTPKPTFTVVPREGAPYDVSADVLLAADGIKSIVRSKILKELGVKAEVTDSGQSSYRIMLTREQMASDPEMLELLDSDRVTRWLGERRHIIAYPISNKNIYNISSAQPDIHFAEAPSATYTTRGSKADMLDNFKECCPLVQRMLNLVPDGEVCEWKLRVHSPLPTWVKGNVALLGDACHPSLPHLNQGAAQAIEDGAVLAVVLSKLPDHSPESINKALRVYELIRKERAETLVDLAAASCKTLHLGEGAAREERDRQFAALKDQGGPSPDKSVDEAVNKMVLGTDVMQIAQDDFEGFFRSLELTKLA
ncbi:FAD/NAD(P)-binding domain-containing protein [Gymnopus androsaceus JB14]|uniref:FAD/NAD(P)-binding domain-containing protein n=1 Tax=Gymnopus androsaceus JB14 TaxID=1447944 RepID=A0A6A4I5B9_9AGAR|nr:FAD/NAD(P)-binding domain-containing protein [Gymnopus androsaceus JB14]